MALTMYSSRGFANDLDRRDSHPLAPGPQPGASTASASAHVGCPGLDSHQHLPDFTRALDSRAAGTSTTPSVGLVVIEIVRAECTKCTEPQDFERDDERDEVARSQPTHPRLTTERSAAELRKAYGPGGGRHPSPRQDLVVKDSAPRVEGAPRHRARESHPDLPVQSRTSCCWTSSAYRWGARESNSVGPVKSRLLGR